MCFKFSDYNLKIASDVIARYPNTRKQSALLPLLHLAQDQNNNHITKDVEIYIADMIGIKPIKVHEVVTFYSMFNTKPVGKFCIQVCCTISCMLRGCDAVMRSCIENLGIEKNNTTDDGMFTLMEVECLGACSNAPVARINNDYFTDLDHHSVIKIIDDIKSNRKT